MNPKRLQKEVRREMEKIKKTTRLSTLAQDYMREELETKKKEKRHRSSVVFLKVAAARNMWEGNRIPDVVDPSRELDKAFEA